KRARPVCTTRRPASGFRRPTSLRSFRSNPKYGSRPTSYARVLDKSPCEVTEARGLMEGTLFPWTRQRRMSQPQGFSWIDKPHLAALAKPMALEELDWLRRQGIDLLVSLTEEPPHPRWINEVGLFLVHEPICDMEAPTQEQLDRCVSAILK